MKTRAKKFQQDKRFKKGEKLILDALKSYQNKVCAKDIKVEPLSGRYKKLLQECSSLRGGNLYFPYLGSGFGSGPFVELADGSVKYDFIGGIGVHFFGHSHPGVISAMLKASIEDVVMQGNLQQNLITKSLLEQFVGLAKRRRSNIRHCFLSTSGAMANENAFKMIFQKKAPAQRLLAFENCFAGRTMAMAFVTDKPQYRQGLPRTVKVDYVPFYDANDPAGSTKRAVAVLNKHIKKYPKQHAGMIFELIQGEGGYYPGTKAFFLALIKVLKRHKIAVMIDEIQTFGRTKELFAFQDFGLSQFVDVVTVGKLTQVCATLFTPEFKPKPGLISQTFTASTSSLYAADYMLRTLSTKNYYGPNGKVWQLSEYFRNKLKDLSQKHPNLIQGPFGYGAMLAMTCGDGSLEQSKKILNSLYDNGVMAFIAGKNPVRIRFLPPFAILKKKDISHALKIVEKTVLQMRE